MNLKTSLSLCGMAMLATTPAWAQSGDGAPAPPANDDCANAIALTENVAEVFDTTDATSLSAFPCQANSGQDVWFTFTPGSTDNYAISACNSSFDTVLEILEGTCGSLTSLDCNDDDCSLQSEIGSVSLTMGTTYYVRLGGFGSGAGAAEILVTLAAPPPMPSVNDLCANALPLVEGVAATFNNDLDTLTDPFSCGSSVDHDVWYTFTPAATSNYRISGCGSTFDSVLEILDGTCGAFTPLDCDDDGCGTVGGPSEIALINLTGGTTYYIRMGGWGGASGDGELLITNLGLASPNDDCANAIALSPGVPQMFDNTDDTIVDPFDCTGFGTQDVWYTFTPAFAAEWQIDTCASSFDTVLEVLDGSCGSFTVVDCNDDSNGICSGLRQSAIITTALTPGTTYYIRVGGWNGANGMGEVVVNRLLPETCATTVFGANNGGAPGGVAFFDVTATQAVAFSSLETNFDATVGSPVGMEVWTTPGTFTGNETNAAVWTMVAMDDGLATSAGLDTPTVINLAAPFTLPAGTTGVALIAVGDGHRYTNGNGTNEMSVSADGVLTLNLGSGQNTPFTSTPFNPRVWNGTLCHESPMTPTGTPFCDPNEVNSTGVAANLTGWFGTGTGSDLHLDADNGPAGEFGYFLVGTAFSDPGLMVSAGRLCLSFSGGGVFGRYNIVGDRMSLGAFDASGVFENLSGTSGTGNGFDVPDTLPLPGSPMIMSGETYHFQLWYRDGSSVSNFTNGLSVSWPVLK